MPGWCNGGAGFVHLWLEADAVIGGRRFLELATAAASGVWQDRGVAWDLCCGRAGGAYALLALHRRTGRRVWLERARELGGQAVRAARADSSSRPWSLYRGLPGIAVLADELDRPADARMPLFA